MQYLSCVLPIPICLWFATISIFVSSIIAYAPDAVAKSKTSGTTKIQKDKKDVPFARKWAVTIGINGFVEKELNRDIKLDSSSKSFQKILVEKFNFDRENIISVNNTKASRDAILSSCGDGWLGRVAQKDDLAIVFLNTFCFPSTDGKTYLCPYDVDFDNFMSTSISTEEFLSNIASSVKCKNILVVFQTLFTGAPEMVAGCRAKFGQYNLNVEKSKLAKNMLVISSSKFNQPTWGTYFSDSLLEAMKNSDHNVKLSRLFKLAHDSTVTNTIKNCRGCKIQSPCFYFLDESKDIKIGSAQSAKKPFVKDELVRALEDSVEVCGKARYYLSYGKTRQALELLRGISEKQESKNVDLKDSLPLPMVSYLQGLIYTKRGEWDKSIPFFTRAVTQRPTSSIYNSQLANALYEKNKDASSFYRKAYKLDPKNIEAVLGLCDNLVENKKGKESVVILERALTSYPYSAELHDRLSYSYSKVGKIDNAIKHAQEAVFLDDSSWTSLINLGALLLAKRSYNEAQVAFRQALDLKPDSSEGYYLLASALERTKDPQGAITALRTFIKYSDKEDKRVALAKKKIEELAKSSMVNK